MRERRQFTAEFKVELVLAVLSDVKSQAEVCRKNQLTPQVFNRCCLPSLMAKTLTMDATSVPPTGQ